MSKELFQEIREQQEGRGLLKPSSLVPSNSFAESLSIMSDLSNIAQTKRNNLHKKKTPPEYIKMKEGFPYLESTYVDDEFNKEFPNHQINIVNSGIFQNYYVYFDVEIIVFLSEKHFIKKVGTGSARVQIKTAAKKAHEDSGRVITPFDYVDFGNSRKAALTLAIKNAQERFGIGADITGRVVLSVEDLEKIKETYTELMSQISDPRDRNRIKEKWIDAKNPNEKLRILEQIKEILQ